MRQQELLSRKIVENFLIQEMGWPRKRAEKHLKELEEFGLVKFTSKGKFMLKEIL